MTAEGAYRCFFETYDNLEDNRQQQRLLLKPKYFESFDNDTKRMLEEKSKVLRWVVHKIPDLQDIEDCRAVVVDYRKNTLRWYNILEDSVPIENELVELKKKLKSENLSDSEKQTVCDQAERLLEKRDEICAEAIRILKTESCPHGFANFSKARSHYQDLIKQYRLSKDCGNQTWLVSTTLKRRQIEEMKLENLKAKKETEQQLRERQLDLEQEREEIELRRQQEELRLQQQQEQELRLKMQQQEDELRL